MPTPHQAPTTEPQRFITDRRKPGPSPLEIASITLSRAVEYLIEQQLQRKCSDVRANRDAIALLCEAVRAVQSEERRHDPRERTAAWLREHYRIRTRLS